jgi:hypothetical protein
MIYSKKFFFFYFLYFIYIYFIIFFVDFQEVIPGEKKKNEKILEKSLKFMINNKSFNNEFY